MIRYSQKEFSAFEAVHCCDQWWIGVMGVMLDDFCGHLFFIGYDMGVWKVDILYLRQFWIKPKEEE